MIKAIKKFIYQFVPVVLIGMILAGPFTWVSAANVSPTSVGDGNGTLASSSMPMLTLEFSNGTLAQADGDYFLDVAMSTTNNDTNQALTIQQNAVLQNLTDPENTSDQKHDYYIRFDAEQSLLGVGAASEFLLLGGMHDKSLIRNYVGYSIAAQVLPQAVDFQLCELTFIGENGESYRGVYLLVALPLRDSSDTLLLHRSEDGMGIVVNSSSTDEEFMTIPYLEGVQWADRFEAPISGLSGAEYVLYSSNPRTFYEYSTRFDTSSFIAAFIIGELTENYAGMTHAYYLYDETEQMLSVAPIWTFDQAFDNQADWPVTTGMIHYSDAPYHESLLKSPQYTGWLQEYYLAVRQNGLEEFDLLNIVDTGVALVASAVSRDWARWDNYSAQTLEPLTALELHEEDADGNPVTLPIIPISRERDFYDTEITRLKTTLREHSLYFSHGITQFDFSEKEVSQEIVLNTNPIWAAVFLIVCFALLEFARRYGV